MTSTAAPIRGHQIDLDWQGQRIRTLAPLWPSEARAVIVGINPAQVSVDKGHYYQGSLGRDTIDNLTRIGILPVPPVGQEVDDAAYARGIGFTDLVPRPTRAAHHLRPDEKKLGGHRLRAQIRQHRPRLVLAVFAEPVHALLGPGHGQPGERGTQFEGARIFKLPVQYTAADVKDQAWADLARLWRDLFPELADQSAP